MVKNLTGGNKGKQFARKGTNQGGISDVLRRVEGINEMYGVVTKIHSARRCEIVGTDSKTYICNIRKKFVKGRKTDTKIPVGVWVIIGFYEWEVRSDGSKTCEILEVYSAIERERLKQLDSVRVAAILHVGENDVNANIKFSSVGSANDTKRTPNVKKNTPNDDEDECDEEEDECDDVDSMVQPEYNDLSEDGDDDRCREDGEDGEEEDCECDSNGNYIVKIEVDTIKTGDDCIVYNDIIPIKVINNRTPTPTQ